MAVVLVVVAAVVVIFLVTVDREEILTALSEADARPLLAALGFMALSYFCVGYSFSLVSRAIGIRMSKRDLTEVGFVSVILNHVVSTGGVAGYSLRYLLMNGQGVLLKDVLSASVIHFYLTSLDMLIMLPVGSVYLLANARVARGVMIAIGTMTALFFIVALLATLLVFFDSWRTPLLRLAQRIVQKTVRRDIGPTLEHFNESFSRGVLDMRKQPRSLAAVVILTWVDWFCSLLVLYFCFDALGPPVRLGTVMSGFVIGIMAGVLSMVPGGFGVQEGSMAGVFRLLGTSYGQAVLASILFRIVYYLLPYFISFVFYGRLLRQVREQVEQVKSEG